MAHCELVSSKGVDFQWTKPIGATDGLTFKSTDEGVRTFLDIHGALTEGHDAVINTAKAFVNIVVMALSSVLYLAFTQALAKCAGVNH